MKQAESESRTDEKKPRFVKLPTSHHMVRQEDHDLDLDNDLNVYFLEGDFQRFVGVVKCKEYTIERNYMNAELPTLRILHTMVTPLQVEPWAQLCIVHGFGEHSGRYFGAADYLARKGIIIYLIDLRGFGLSGGTRASANISELHYDIGLLLKHIKRPDLPLFIGGQSMGGGLVSSFALRNPNLNISGIILMSSLLGTPNERKLSFMQKNALAVVGETLLNDITVNSLINATALSKNTFHIRKCVEDSLINPFCSMRLATSVFKMIDFNQANAKYLKYPLLILHGDDDCVTNIKFAQEYFDKAVSTNDKTMKIFPHARHEPLHDKEKGEFLEALFSWCKSRVNRYHLKFGEPPQKFVYGVVSPKPRLWIIPAIIFMIYVFKRSPKESPESYHN